MIADANAILRAWLVTQADLTDVVGQRLYVPRLPEGATLPALSFAIRGGTANPHIPPLPEPSFQFDCWGTTPQEAREVYRALYTILQGLQNASITIGATTYAIKSAIEEVQGQDIQPVDPMNYHRVLAFFSITIEV